MKNKVTNTATVSPFLKLLVGMGENGSGIEAQEAQGQRELLKSSQMPVKVNSPYEWKGKGIELYRQLGFIFEDNGEGILMDATIGDRLFVDCYLPEGWKKRGSDHSMWTYIDDHQGRERMSVFYKAAFYDRDAFINLTTRYTTGTENVLPPGEKPEDWYYKPQDHLPQYGYIKDAGKIIYQTESLIPVKDAPYDNPGHYLRQYSKLEAEVKEKVLELFPHYADPLAYWD